MQESGYTFTIEDHPRIFQGTVALISADNPASNSLGGFKEGATAYRHCRQCMGTYDQTAKEVLQYAIIKLHIFYYIFPE